jgi:hypothetical protein
MRFLMSLVGYFMPDWPSTTKWMTEEERLLAAARLAYDGLGNTQGATGHIGEMQAVKLVVKDWRTWGFVVMYMLCTGAQTIQYFVPTLVASRTLSISLRSVELTTA